MRPDESDLDEEIRGHLAISIKERIDRGEDPVSARRAALREFGYLPAVRDEMRRVWYSRWYDQAEALARDIRFALRALVRAKTLTVTVIATLALGIGANAAIFSVVRSVLLRPLVNRDANRLIYIRQTALGIATENLTFSVPEINDFRSSVTTIAAFGDFSTVDFTLIGFGNSQPRLVKAGVVNGSFFDVMGLRPVLGRLLNAADDIPGAAGAVVLTHRFWTTVLQSDPTVIGQTIRLGPSIATVVGVLEPSRRALEVSWIGQAVGADRPQLRKTEGRAVVLADIASRRGAQKLDPEPHPPRHDRHLKRANDNDPHLGNQSQRAGLRDDQQLAVGVHEHSSAHRTVSGIEMDGRPRGGGDVACRPIGHEPVDEIGRRRGIVQRIPSQAVRSRRGLPDRRRTD